MVKFSTDMKRRFIESVIRSAMFGLRYAVAWRMKKMGFRKEGNVWTKDREKILPVDPQVSVSVHEKNAIIELVQAANATIFKS